MSTIATTPFPLLKDEDLLYAQNTHRFAPLLHADVAHPCAEDQWTCWTCEPMPSVCIPEPAAVDKMFSVYMAVLVRLLQARANNELTRPLELHGPWVRADDVKRGMLLVQLKGSARPPSIFLRPLPTEDERPQPEFTWSKTLYKARKAAQEYSQETHADH